MSVINEAVEAVMDLIDSLDLYAPIRRGALGTGNGICCEVGPSGPESTYMDKNQYIPLDLTVNARHSNLEVLSDALNMIHEHLTMLFEYPHGENWKIVEITTLTEPQVVGREEDNAWTMASALNIYIYTSFEREG